MNNKENLYTEAVKHQHEHACGAHVYENIDKLIAAVKLSNPNEILEIGTGIGYTSVIMAQTVPQAHIDTLEKDPGHAELAQIFINTNAPESSQNIKVITESAELFLPTIQKQYDFIFFDGYQIHYEFLPQYERLLKPGGTLFLANNHLKSKSSDQFFEQLLNSHKWEIIEQFADTTIAKRL